MLVAMYSYSRLLPFPCWHPIILSCWLASTSSPSKPCPSCQDCWCLALPVDSCCYCCGQDDNGAHRCQAPGQQEQHHHTAHHLKQGPQATVTADIAAGTPTQQHSSSCHQHMTLQHHIAMGTTVVVCTKLGATVMYTSDATQPLQLCHAYDVAMPEIDRLLQAMLCWLQ